jgi:Ferritin-like
MQSEFECYPGLLQQLALACELEHGLCLTYLFAAYSLKSRIEEGGMNSGELNSVRTWKANLFFVAAQEMLHLAQAGNLSTAAGSGLNLRRPNFPQRPNYYPTGLPWGLWPFSQSALVLFALYERPSQFKTSAPAWLPAVEELNSGLSALLTDAPSHKDPFYFLPEGFARPAASQFITIEALYRAIGQGFQQSGPVIVGPPQAQVSGEMVDFPQLLQVFQLEDALAGIELIIEQGEGSSLDRGDSHFGIFVRMYQEYTALRAQRAEFDPVRDVQSNPLSRLHPDNTYPGWRLIQDPFTRQVNDLHNDVYLLMLHMLRYVFTCYEDGPSKRKTLGQLCLRIMTGVLAPLGETLTQLPMGMDDSPGAAVRARFAGPSFETSFTQIDLPFSAAASRYLTAETGKLAEDAHRLSQSAGAPSSLAAARLTLLNLRDHLKALFQAP